MNSLGSVFLHAVEGALLVLGRFEQDDGFGGKWCSYFDSLQVRLGDEKKAQDTLVKIA
jgi:hypothetical protein